MLNSPMLTRREYNILEGLIKLKRPLTVKQMKNILIGCSQANIDKTIKALIADNLIHAPKDPNHYVITLSGWNAWEHTNQFGVKVETE